jgi:DNA modification methylase
MNIRNRVKALRTVKASELAPNPKNWRTHPKAQQDALRGILAEVGYADALLARELPDGSLMLVDGHLRAETTPDQEVPVLVLDINEAEADKLLLSLDPLAALAETNAQALDALLREVDTGSEGLQQMYADMAEAAELYQDGDKEIVEDEVPEPPVDPITKPGDLWILGDHRLLCGDSTKTEDVERLMAGAKADLCFTSPPYGQQRDYTEEGKAKVADWDCLMRGVFGNLPMADAGQVLVNLGMIHRDGEWVPYWDAWIAWMREQGWRRFGWYVWDQTYGLPGDWQGRLAPSHEFVFHFNRKVRRPQKWIEKHEENVVMLTKERPLRRKDGRTESATSPESGMQTHKIPDSVIRECRQQSSAGIPGEGHPAPFSKAFASHGIKTWTIKGESAYEPFCGSGTTLIAAEQLGRKCYGMEISPQYCDVIVKRWETLAGKKAELESSNGQTRPAQRADDHQDRQGQPRQKAAQQKRAKAAKR